MVPRIDITAIEQSMTFGQIRELVARDGHSRYPVYKENIDHVVGLIYVKDLFNRMPEPGEKFDLTPMLRKPFLIPGTKIIGELLREFQLRRQHLAIVVDDYGGVAGLVTLEDIIEEVFGEIRDEHDVEEEELLKLPDGRYRVSAALMLERLQDELDTDYESGDHDSVGGLIYDLVGSVPRQGQTVRWHDLEFEVERMSGQRIVSVLVRH
jgi:magnesium and cobalt transporter